MKPVIAITPLYDNKLESLWMLDVYINAIKESGGIPLILTFDYSKEDLYSLLDRCDGILLTGGQDIEPFYYKEDVTYSKTPSILKDKLEEICYNYAKDKNKALFGICRGLQFMNCLEGGTLYQDLSHEFKTDIIHDQTKPYDKPVHSVNILKDTVLYDILKTENIDITSLHHQAIKKLGNNLEVQALSPDGLVEAIRLKGYKFILSVQWHPEYTFKNKEDSKKLFKAFIEYSKK